MCVSKKYIHHLLVNEEVSISVKDNINNYSNDENQLAVKNIWNEKLKEVQLVIVEKINNGTCLYTHPHTAQLQDD